MDTNPIIVTATCRSSKQLWNSKTLYGFLNSRSHTWCVLILGTHLNFPRVFTRANIMAPIKVFSSLSTLCQIQCLFSNIMYTLPMSHTTSCRVWWRQKNFASCNFWKTTKGHKTSSRARRDYATTSSQLQSLAAYDSKSSPRMCFHISSSSHTRLQVALDLTSHSHSTSRRIRPRVECGAYYYNFIVQSNFYAWH